MSSGTAGRTFFQNGSGFTLYGLMLILRQPLVCRSALALLAASACDISSASPLVSALWVAEMISQSAALA